jgi:hypothetical protein
MYLDAENEYEKFRNIVYQSCKKNTPAEFKQKIAISVLELLKDQFCEPEFICELKTILNASESI